MTNLIAWLLNKAQDLILREPVRFLALGDSCTIGERVQVAERWPEQLFNSIAANGFETEKLTIIARTGWTAGVLKEAILAKNPPKEFNLVSLLIGVNDGRTDKSLAVLYKALIHAIVSPACTSD
jgi:hypothetical protein